jgi:hypothetical protein
VGDGDGAGDGVGVEGWVVGVGVEGWVVGVEGLLADVVVAGPGALVVGSAAFGEDVVRLGLGVVGSVVAPGVRPATAGESLLATGSEAKRSAGEVSPRVKVRTIAVAIVVTTAVTTILWVLLMSMGVLLAVIRARDIAGRGRHWRRSPHSLAVHLLGVRIVQFWSNSGSFTP